MNPVDFAVVILVGGQVMLCNCGHRISDHVNSDQCRLCECPVVIWTVPKEVWEWKKSTAKRANAPTEAEARRGCSDRIGVHELR